MNNHVLKTLTGPEKFNGKAEKTQTNAKKSEYGFQMGIIVYPAEESVFVHLSLPTTCKELQKCSEAMISSTQQSPVKEDMSTALVPMKQNFLIHTP